MLLFGSCVTVVSPGASVSRTVRSPRASVCMLGAPTLLLSKLDLAQVREEREALDAVINQIDRNIATAVPIPVPVPVPDILAESSALAATVSAASTLDGITPLDALWLLQLACVLEVASWQPRSSPSGPPEDCR